MIRRAGLLLVLSMVAAPMARAEMFVSEVVSPFAQPSFSGRAMALNQIGGTSTKPKDGPNEAILNNGPDVINPRKAMLYSLILPGLGQQAAGRKERARVFYAVEAGIWTSFAVFRIQGAEQQDRYIEYAEFTAGANAEGKDDEYWRTLAQYERSDPGPGSANEFIRRQARAQFPGDRAKQEEYFAANGYFENENWDWQNADNLARYQGLRSKSLDSYDRAEFSIFAAIANRVVSVIDAARVAGQANRAAAEARKDTGSGFGNTIKHLGFKLKKDGDDRIPMVTWKMKF